MEIEKQKQKEQEEYLSTLPLKQVDKKELALIELEASLFIIGNGFDLMHRIPSSYYNFRDTIGKSNRLRFTLETYIKSDDIWGDFESSLAYLDRESMLSTIDMWLHDFNVLDDDDFSAADYFAAYDIIQKVIYNTFGKEDDDFVRRIYISIDESARRFFDRYGEYYGEKMKNFLSIKENYDIILVPLYFTSEVNLARDIIRGKESGDFKVDDVALDFFIGCLHKIMMKDIRLNEYLSLKDHVEETKVSNKKIENKGTK